MVNVSSKPPLRNGYGQVQMSEGEDLTTVPSPFVCDGRLLIVPRTVVCEAVRQMNYDEFIQEETFRKLFNCPLATPNMKCQWCIEQPMFCSLGNKKRCCQCDDKECPYRCLRVMVRDSQVV